MESSYVIGEELEQDARRYYLLRAYLLLTGLNRGVRLKVSLSKSESQRYRLLRDQVLSTGIVRHVKLPPGQTTPFVVGKEFYGETVEDAVDTLVYLSCMMTPNSQTESIH